jgi:histidine triad (HIT) family protein
MSDCIFCKIIAGELPAETVYQDDACIAIRDINPHAPKHLLIIPRRHLDGIAAMTAADEGLIGHLFWAATQVAAQEGIAASGYRLVINEGRDGGQAVPHLHVHLLGGTRLSFPNDNR